MALQTSGQISLNDINIELGNASGTTISMNDSGVRGLIGKADGASMSISEWYGAANEVTLTSAGTVNGQDQRQQITASSFVSSGGTLVIPSNLWVWSNSTGVAALTIDIPCTIKNSGKIIGRGGNGGNQDAAGSGGGPAIKINSGISGVTIINLSGAYIAGGGGGGGGGYYNSAYSAGGGGAGGGDGGVVGGGSYYGYAGTGGSLNASGTNATKDPPFGNGSFSARGGGSGGGAGGLRDGTTWNGHGAGGGRILPGTGGQAYTPYVSGSYAGSYVYGGYHGGRGGSAGSAGQQPASSFGGGGGGGWGASGGNSTRRGGGGGGAAISDSGNTYTLTNSGTIYGGT